jgi:hypothetical protein
MITTLSTEEIEEKLIMHQHSLMEQHRATQSAKGVFAAVKTNVRNGAGLQRRTRGLDDTTKEAIANYDRTAAWKAVENGNQCAIHRQLGMTQNHKTKQCFLRMEPEAASIVRNVDERMQQYRQQRKATQPQPKQEAPRATQWPKPNYKGGRKSVKFK